MARHYNMCDPSDFYCTSMWNKKTWGPLTVEVENKDKQEPGHLKKLFLL